MTYWLVALLAAFTLGLSKGGLPVIAILSVPLMALYLDPAMAAGLLLPLYLIADCYAIYLFRRAFSLENLKVLIPAAILGVTFGFFWVSQVSTEWVKLLLVIIGFSYLARAVMARLSKQHVPARPASFGRGLFWGALAGLTSYIAHAGGPPYQAYLLPQKLEKMVYLGTTTIFFASVNLMKVIPYVLAGQMTGASVLQSLWLAPAALLGAYTAARFSFWVSERVFFLLVEIALGLVSAKLLWEVLEIWFG